MTYGPSLVWTKLHKNIRNGLYREHAKLEKQYDENHSAYIKELQNLWIEYRNHSGSVSEVHTYTTSSESNSCNFQNKIFFFEMIYFCFI